jgi:uncharacterized protein (DUF1499 family)
MTGFLSTLLLLFGCSGDPALRSAATGEGRLPPCPDKPNCVSTRSDDPARKMEPLPFVGSREESRNRVLEIVRGMKRSEVVEASDAVVHVEFRSLLFRFVDDVVFVFDESERLVHFRSASRVGTYDFGVNRRRMEEISRRYGDGLS